MLEWNIFVKPVMYVLELIFGAVVTFGTADKLLYWDNAVGAVRCRMSDSLGACISVIIIGSLALITSGLILWRRLIAAFDDDIVFKNTIEAQWCAFVSILWLVVASVVTGKTGRIGRQDPRSGEKVITLVFSWLLFALTAASAAVAWFVPYRDILVADGALLASSDMLPSDLQPFGQDALTDSDIGCSEHSAENHDSECSPGAPLVRLNAARSLGAQSEKSAPDTEWINSKLSSWESVLEGPPKDAHSVALGAAVRMPFPGTSVSSAAVESRESSKSGFGVAESRASAGLPPRPEGMRRRMVRFPKASDDDEIRPVT